MKHLEEFRQAVQQPFDYARQLKKATGKKIIGYVCSYTPEEIILAAGGASFPAFRHQGEHPSCRLPSPILLLLSGAGGSGGGLSGRIDFLDGMVFPHTCDSIQRLSDIWRMNIPFGFHPDVVLPVKLNT